MLRIDSVGCAALLIFAGRMLTLSSLTTMTDLGHWACARRPGPPRTTRVLCLLLHQLRLYRAGQLGGEVDVTRQAGLALHRIRLAGRRVLEHERREVRACRLLATGCERHGPVDREACMVVLGRYGEELERGVLRHILLPEAPQHVAVGGCERRDLAAA